jgi:hypothetical protein
MLFNRHHLRCENACRTIEGRKSLVESSHVSAYSWFLLDQVDFLAGICDLKCCFDSGYSSSHNEDVRIDWDLLHFERFVECHSRYGGPNNGLCSLRCKFSIGGYPGALFAYVCHLE